jgi:hypothetical protein
MGDRSRKTGQNDEQHAKLDVTKVINSLSEAVGDLGDSVTWSLWRARFLRLCSLYTVDTKKKDDYGYVNAVIERVVVRGSSVAAVIETHMLRDSDSFSLLDILDNHFKLVDNPLLKIRKIKGMSFEESGMNLLDFARAVFALCAEVGIAKEADQCLWVLACFGADVMAKLPQDILAINTKEKMQTTLAAVMTKFDMQRDGVRDDRASVSAISQKPKSNNTNSSSSKATTEREKKELICFACGNPGHYSDKCNNPVKLSEEEQKKLRDAFFAKKKKKSDGASVKAISVSIGKKLNANVTVDGVSTAALLDTGATISIVHPDVLQSSNVLVRPSRACEVSAEFANGETTVLKEQVRVKIVIDDKEYDHWVFVYARASHRVLLGMDFLDGKANIDLVRGSIEFMACAVEAESRVMSEWREKSRACLEKIRVPEIREVVAEYIEKFYEVNKREWLPCKFKEFEIRLKDDVPISVNPYRYAKMEQDVIDAKFRDWIANGFARKSSSEFASPALVVDKPQPADEKYRVCGNYRKLNDKTIPKKYPMPNIDELIDRAHGQLFSVIDGYDAYHQVAIREADVHKTALISHNGKVELLRMQYGMVGAGFHFQEGIDEMLGEARGKFANAVVDDVLVYSDSQESHVVEVREVLERMFQKNLLPKFWKCQFGEPRVQFCGREISAEGIGLGQQKVQALMNLRAPECKAELESLIGLIIWHGKWIPKLGEDLLPLIECRKSAKSGVPFPWNEECEKAVERIKRAIAAATVRARSGPGVYHIYTDSSDFCVSWHVVRVDRGKEHLMFFGSHVLTDTELRYSVPKKELYAIALACHKSRWTCLGRDVVIHTDQISWSRDIDLKSPTGVIAQWLEWVNELHPSAVFIKGERNVVADCLSRLTPANGPAEGSAEDVVAAIESEKKIAEKFDEKKGPVFVPEEWRVECIRAVHDGFLGAHLGKTKLWECIRLRYYWPGMAEDIKNYKCEFCDVYKPDSRDTRNPMTVIEAKRPWEMVGVDIVPVTMKNGQRVYYFIGVDYFTKKVVTKRMKVTTAAELINAVCFQIVFPFGTPCVIVSDRGTQLVGEEFTAWCRERGIQHLPATEYHQQGNGQCERMVRVLSPILLSKIVQYKLKFKVALAVATAAINKFLISSTTGVSADHALFGLPPVSDFDLRLARHLESLEKVRESMAEKSKVAKEKQKENYDAGKVERSFRVGQLVRVRSRARGQQELFTGPAEVIKVLDRDNYVVWDYERYKSVTVNVCNLRLFENATSLPNSKDVLVRESVHGGGKFEERDEMMFSSRSQEKSMREMRARRIEMVKSPPRLVPPIRTNAGDDFKPGTRIAVFWAKPLGEDRYYPGTIVGKSRVIDGKYVDGGTHDIDYDDLKESEPHAAVSDRAVSENLTGEGPGEIAKFRMI